MHTIFTGLKILINLKNNQLHSMFATMLLF